MAIPPPNHRWWGGAVGYALEFPWSLRVQPHPIFCTDAAPVENDVVAVAADGIAHKSALQLEQDFVALLDVDRAAVADMRVVAIAVAIAAVVAGGVRVYKCLLQHPVAVVVPFGPLRPSSFDKLHVDLGPVG